MAATETTKDVDSLPNRPWTIDQEIRLFSLVCDYKPAGPKKHENMAIIINKINEDIQPSERPLRESDIWDKLDQLYDLPKIDLLEGLSGDEVVANDSLNYSSDSSPINEKKSKENVQHAKPSIAVATTNAKDSVKNDSEEDNKDERQFSEEDDAKREKDANTISPSKDRQSKSGHEITTRRRLRHSVNEDPEISENVQNSGRARDIKSEVGEIPSDTKPSKTSYRDDEVEASKEASGQENQTSEEDSPEAAPARRTRGRRHVVDHDVITIEPPRKKTRSNIKSEDSSDEAKVDIVPAKKSKSTAPVPQPPLTRRRTRSEAHTEQDDEDEAEVRGNESKTIDSENDSAEDVKDEKKPIRTEKKNEKHHKNTTDTIKPTVRRSSRGANTTPAPSKPAHPVRRSTRKR
ncbi:EAF7 [Candida margitis]|uniref:EAF7 n=1 Tax=Candida margitis TaxID=1775924 RepID=UPI0022262C9B|nr:EAF7 [Candida margitis]KAI5969686.1 EAF7 [Candida margitis]